MTQSFINVVIPFPSERSDRVNEALCALAQPKCGNRPSEEIERILTDIGTVHFMTIVVARPICPAELSAPPPGPAPAQRSEQSHLLIEISADPGTEETLTILADKLGPQLRQVLSAAGIELGGASLGRYLLRRSLAIGATWGSDALGQVFSGSPGQSVWRINQEERLAARVGALIEKEREDPVWHESSPRQRLERVRDKLWDEGEKWAFVPQPAPCLAGDPHNKWNPASSISNPQLRKAVVSILNGLLWPLYPLLGAVVLGVLAFTYWDHGPDIQLMWTADVIVGLLVGLIVALAAVFGPSRPWLRGALIVLATFILTWLVGLTWAAVVILGLFVALLAALATVFAAAYLWLRHLEQTDPVEDLTPPSDQVEALMKVENFCAQNHLASVSRLKPERLRRLTSRLAFIIVGTGRFVGAPGFLGKNGVIHFARWMRLPGTDQLVFWSNFDGTWESYVADFIADAPSGVSAIWSNCVGFPRTEGLVAGGAKDRDRLVRWARRQQTPTLFWYSAYRDLTAERIRINAAVRQGLASAESDADARDWFDLFGSAPRLPDALQTTQIPTLVFGGLSNLPHASCHVVALDADVRKCKQWLSTVAAEATFGETAPGQKSAIAVAFSRTGLEKVGVPPDAIETFPVAFQQGMWPEWRARALGDTDCNAPARWAWGVPNEDENKDTRADVLLLVYGLTPGDLRSAQEKLVDEATRIGRVYSLPLTPLPEKIARAKGDAAGAKRRQFPKEPFGFADGVSQPVIRGTSRSKMRVAPNDLVAAGEIVLGYPDNLGKVPPSPSIADEDDPGHLLPDAGTDPLRRRPEFSRYEGDGRRDLGANGTFLVIRQLEQNAKAFDDWLETAVEQIKTDAIVAVDPKPSASEAAVERIKTDTGVAADPKSCVSEASAAQRIALVWGNRTQDQVTGSPLPRPRAGNLSAIDWSRGSYAREKVKEAIAAKLVGRWKDGTSLVRHPLMPGTEQDPPTQPDNAFLLGAEDRGGLACPLGAHIRRANPRDTRFPGSADEIASTNRHRILRVGRRYGPPCTQEREQGLLFMCLNVDIERQFEFIQKTWLLNPNLHGLENEVDPVMGHGSTRIVTVPTPTGAVRLTGLTDFVTMKGGGYFFLPGRAVLRYLST